MSTRTDKLKVWVDILATRDFASRGGLELLLVVIMSQLS